MLNTTFFLDLVETALELLEDKTMRLGTGLQSYALISSAYGLARDTVIPGQARKHEKQAADRITSIQYKMRSFQDNLSHHPILIRAAQKVRSHIYLSGSV